MEFDYVDLKALGDIVDFAIENGKDVNVEFYERVKLDIQPFIVMLPLLKFAKRSTISIPMMLVMDLNSIVREFGNLPKGILHGKKTSV